MLTKEIADIEKGCGTIEWGNNEDRVKCGDAYLCGICEAKLSTLKSAQQKFDKFKQEELEFLKLLNSVDNNKIGELIDQRITLFVSQQRNEHIGKSVSADELSSKQEESNG
jgi:hypothetical protein